MGTIGGVGPIFNPPDPKDLENPVIKYAMLLLQVARNYNATATNQMDDLGILQGQQQEANKMLEGFNSEVTKLEQAGGSGTIYMSPAEKAWCDANGVATPGHPWLNLDQWSQVAKDTQSVVDKKGTEIQQLMNLIKEAVGQYSSFLQGSSTNTTASNQMLNSLAKNMA